MWKPGRNVSFWSSVRSTGALICVLSVHASPHARTAGDTRASASPALPASAALPGSPALPTRQDPSFRSTSAELVVLPIIVKDKQGRYIGDLSRERFVVYDNARRMPVEFFTAEDTPVTIGLVIDGSGSM